jgi:hypothetical protein
MHENDVKPLVRVLSADPSEKMRPAQIEIGRRAVEEKAEADFASHDFSFRFFLLAVKASSASLRQSEQM